MKKGIAAERIDDICNLGECKGKGTYVLKASCVNCNWKGDVEQTKGHHSYTFECPNCGCEEVRTD